MKKIEYSLLSKYRSVLMGLSIVSIIIFHFTDDVRIYTRDVLHSTDYNIILKMINKFIGSSGVDIFLILSGLGLYYSFKKSKNFKTFYKKRFFRILIAYFLISVPSILVYDLILTNGSMITVLKDFFFITFYTEYNTWFWYIMMSIFCYLLFPYFYEIFDEKQSEESELMRLMNFFTFFYVIAICLFCTNRLAFNRVNIMLLRFPSFIFGIYLGKKSYNNKSLEKRSLITFIIISLFSLLLIVNNTNSIMVRPVIAMLAISYFSLIILFIDKFKNCFIIKLIISIFSKIGEYTLELYLLHVAFRRLFPYIDLYPYVWKHYLILVLACCILAVIIKKISNIIEKLIIKK